jgi:hypothetical protein
METSRAFLKQIVEMAHFSGNSNFASETGTATSEHWWPDCMRVFNQSNLSLLQRLYFEECGRGLSRKLDQDALSELRKID